MQYCFGADIGGTSVKLGLFSSDGKLLEKWEIPTDRSDSGEHILPDVAAAVNGCIQRRTLSQQAVLGIGVGVPGPVDDDGCVNRCINLGWDQVQLHKTLHALTGLAVKAANDANVAALGEFWQGGAKGCSSMVLATLGTGIGGGVILNGRICSGAHGAGGEIGHITVNPDETEPCGCGKFGCVEQYGSATGIVRTARQLLCRSSAPSALRSIDKLTCKDIFDAAAAGDALADEILDITYRYLGHFLADVSCVVDPECIVLGGGVSRAGEPLLHGVQRYFRQFMFHACRDTRFALATLGNDAGIYGCCKLILDLPQNASN